MRRCSYKAVLILLTGLTALYITTSCIVNFDRLMANHAPAIILWPFTTLITGITCTTIGIYGLTGHIRRVWRIRRLIKANKTVDAQIFGCIADWNHMRRGQPTHRILLSYRNNYATPRHSLQFQSQNLISEPNSDIIGKTCKVYLNPKINFGEYYGVFENLNRDFCHYYVDVSTISTR